MGQIIYKNTAISYSDIGTGTAVVLLHGFLENKTMWRDLVPALSKKNRVVIIDLLGHGQSECLGYVHSMEENAEIVKAILSHIKIRKTIIVGHSMGGYVALAFAELFPQFIKGLVLLNSTTKEDSEERKINRDRAIKAVKQNYINFVRMSIANLFSENNRNRLENEIENVKLDALKTPLQGIIASLEGMKIRKDRQFILKETDFPKMLILGEKDGVLLYEDNLAQIENTNAELITFADGHMSHIENKEDLEKVIIDFLRKIK
jgi:pimeloyl-ACP methyl ester carboxylesterase